MTRTVPAPLLATLNTSSFKLATLFHIELPNGSVFTLTDWDSALETDMMGSPTLSYSPAEISTSTNISSQLNAGADDTEMTIIANSADFTADDFRRGQFSSGSVTIGYVDPDDLGNAWLFSYYDIGNVDIKGLEIKLELLGPERRLEKDVGRVLTANCPFALGDKDCKVAIRADSWAGNATYALGDVVQRATGSGIYWFTCTTAGQAGGTEPTWPSTLGGTVTDGTVEWTAIYARRMTGTVATVTDRKTFTATGVSVTNDYFAEGFLTWQTGDNAGDKHRVRSDDGAGSIVIHISAFDEIQIGDTFEVVSGCRLRITEDCKTKFDNVNRFGGFPFLADENVTMAAKVG